MIADALDPTERDLVLVGVDMGGTFTDVVCSRGDRMAIVKLPSNREAPGLAVLSGVERALAELGASVGDIERLVHGTTVATNAIVERKGARVGLLTTRGFEDVLEIGRLKRTNLYDWAIDSQTPTFVAPRERRCGVDERIDCGGRVLRKLDVRQLASQLSKLQRGNVEALAVCYLFSYVNPEHEQKTRGLVAALAPELPISLSSEVNREYREYERTVVTVFDAYLRPVVQEYLGALERNLAGRGLESRLQVMRSRGGIASAKVGASRPIEMVLSGPAGGAAGARHVALEAGYPNLIGVDMGGTSCDVSLIVDGVQPTVSQGQIAGYPVRVPMVDVITIGAGGGSIIWVDRAGRMRVGPQSAGADPGPVCYGRGGVNPTVTDASLVLGYLNPDTFAMGRLQLDREAAHHSLGQIGSLLNLSAGEVALGAHRIVNAKMIDQIRLLTVKRGLDPRRFSLLAFGGAGPVHGQALSQQLSIGVVVVPPAAGILAALGLLTAGIEHERKQTFLHRLIVLDIVELEIVYQQLEKDCLDAMQSEGVERADARVTHLADFRYVGQSSELTVPMTAPISSQALAAAGDAFQELHMASYGYINARDRIELVNARVVAEYAVPRRPLTVTHDDGGNSEPYAMRLARFQEGTFETPVYLRSALAPASIIKGPAIIEQPDTTTIVYPGGLACLDASSNLLLSFEKRLLDPEDLM